MKLNPPNLNTTAQAPTKQDDLKKKLKLVRAGHGIADSIRQGNVEQALTRTIVSGIKLADANPFTDPHANPMALVAELKSLGIASLGWAPESLFSAIDRKYFGWSNEKASAALEKFHETGVIQTEVPIIVRQKIYAIRVVATSDTAHNEWHIFEKIGSAFNDRIAHFGVVEKLSPSECARTIALIESIRPDEYSREIKVYVAASAHEDGIVTLAPSKYLKMADSALRQMNLATTGASILKPDLVERITKKMEILKAEDGKIQDEDIITIQALKLLAIDHAGDEASL